MHLCVLIQGTYNTFVQGFDQRYRPPLFAKFTWYMTYYIHQPLVHYLKYPLIGALAVPAGEHFSVYFNDQ